MSSPLASTTVANLLAKGKLVTIKHSLTVAEGLEVLRKAKIHTAPVMEGSKCLGLVDTRDFLAHILETGPDTFNNEDSLTMGIRSAAFGKTPMKDLVNISGQNPTVTITLSATIEKAAQEMVSKRLLRLSVVDDKGVLIGVLSLSKILAWLATQPELMKTLASIPLSKVKTSPPETIRKHLGTLQAIIKLLKHKAPALAVVEPESSALIAVFSPSDLKGLTVATYSSLVLNVWDFLTMVAPDGQTTARGSTPPQTLLAEHTLADAATRVAASNRYQIFVTDTKNAPTGLLTLLDILAPLVPGASAASSAPAGSSSGASKSSGGRSSSKGRKSRGSLKKK